MPTNEWLSVGRQACCQSLVEYGGHALSCPMWHGMREPMALTRSKMRRVMRLNPNMHTRRKCFSHTPEGQQ